MTTWNKVILGVGLALLVLIALSAVFYFGFPAEPEPDLTLPTPPMTSSTFATGIFWGGFFILLGLLLPKEPWDWLATIKPLLMVLGCLVIVFTIAFSGIGNSITKWLNRVEACIATQDCERRADDIPIINGGTVELPRNGVRDFYAVGKVAIRNYAGYCVGVSPKSTFKMSETPNARLVFIEACGGEKTFVTVTSKPASQCQPPSSSSEPAC